MAADVVNRDQGDAQRQGGGLGKVDPHQHRADQARGKGDGHRVQVSAGKLRRGQRLLGQRDDGLHVFARGDFRHHAAIELVHFNL